MKLWRTAGTLEAIAIRMFGKKLYTEKGQWIGWLYNGKFWARA